MENKETKRCTKCGRELPLESFGKNASAPDGLNRNCKECVRGYQNARNKMKKTQTVNVDPSRPLAKSTPRELIMELRIRGYKGKITYLQEIEL